MPEMRFNPITLDWVIMAPERAFKPNEFANLSPRHADGGPHRPDCPFCAGNENLAPPEVDRISSADGGWAVRVVPNKYSAFVAGEDLHRKLRGTFRSMPAAGSHEVVIEHPRHGLTLKDMPPAHLAEIFRMFRRRYQALRKTPSAESIVIFKNQGERAGSSLEHSHSQITAAPILSSQVCMRLQEARRYYQLNGRCLHCQVLQDELADEERVLEVGSAFAAFVPFAALSPFHLWIFPRRHVSSYDEITDAETEELGAMLSRLLRRLALVAHDPDYNFTIRSAPASECDTHYHHWYLAIVPRINHLAGFELGSGTYINSLRAEAAAELLRAAPVGDQFPA